MLRLVNIKYRAYETVPRLVGLRREIVPMRVENSTLKEQLYTEGKTANRKGGESRRLIPHSEPEVKTQRDKLTEINEDLAKQRTLVRSERSERKAEKLIKEELRKEIASTAVHSL